MGHILLDRLEHILYNHLIVLIPVTFKPGLIISPSNNPKIDFDALVHVNFDIVLPRIDIIHDCQDFDLVVLEAVFNDVHFFNLFQFEELLN